jgi:hypothetical protein
MINSRKPLFIGACIAILHFVASWTAFTRSAVIQPIESTATWQQISKVLAFPMVYLSNVITAIDIFPVLFIANSLLWGAVAYLMIKALKARGQV